MTERYCFNRLKEIMDSKEIYQKDLAKGTGISRKTINRYANGYRLPNVADAILIATFLNEPVESIWY